MSSIHSDNPYTILDIDKSANIDDIKKAYRKLALKYHPDKYKNDIEFKKINNAYQILINPQKKKLYDICNMVNTNELNNLMNQIISIMFELIKGKFASKSTKVESTDNLYDKNIDNKICINLQINISLDELYVKSNHKKIVVKVKRILQSDRIIRMESISLIISLLNFEDIYFFKGLGDDYIIDNKIYRGDIKIKLIIIEHPEIKMDKYLFKYDLYIDKTISLYGIYYGIDCIIDFLNNEKIQVKRNFVEDIYSNNLSCNNLIFMHVIKEKGLPYYIEENDDEKRGDLYIYFKLELENIDLFNNNIQNFLKVYFNGA